MKKKGQAAMEFLMTYGWAILVVLIAIGSLAYFGVLNPSRFLPNSCTIAPGLGCDDFKVEATTVQLVLRNGMGTDLTNVDVSIGGCTSDPQANGAGVWTDGEVLDDATAGIILTSCPALTAGTRFKEDVNLTYRTSGSGIDHLVVGSLIARVE